MTNEQLNLAETITDYINRQKWLSERDMRTLAHLRNDAVCVDSPIGEYRCQVEIMFSPQSGREPICVDTCLQHEIHELIFKHNVNTIGCCCGHGRKQAYIQVSPQSVKKMHELGYELLPEKEAGQGKWCFKPKTYFPEPVNVSYNLTNGYRQLVNTAPPRNEGLFNVQAEAGEMLDILKRECEEAEEQLLADVCDNCHWQYVLSQEALDEHCKTCTVESDLETLLKKARTIAVGETMQITAEEMHPRKEGE